MEKLTIQEEEAMQYIWQLGSCTIKEILALMPHPQPPYTTLASVVNNLKRKKYVLQERKGNTYVYAPAVKEADYKRHFMAGFVRNYFRNSFKDLVSFFAHEDKISPEELQDIIDEIETGIRN